MSSAAIEAATRAGTGASPPRRRVLHVLGNFNSGGTERQAVEAARLLSKDERFDVSFACLDRVGPLLDELRGFGFADPDEFPIASFFRPGTLAQAWTFSRFLRRERIHVVHCHEFYSNVFGLFSAAIAGTPVRIGARRNTGGSHASSEAKRRVERLAFRTAHAVVANGSAVRESLVLEGVRADRIAVVPNAVDVERFRSASPSALPREIGSPGTDAAWITCVANMRHAVKDQETLLRAAALVAERHPQTVFVLVGEGELEGAYRALARDLGLEKRVVFAGRIDDVAPVLLASFACVLASRAEGMSNAILEYQASGRPVVVTDVGAARDIVVDGTTGLIVPPGNPEALAEGLLVLLGDPERAAEMGRAGQARVADLFSPQALARNLAELYERLLPSGGRS